MLSKAADKIALKVKDARNVTKMTPFFRTRDSPSPAGQICARSSNKESGGAEGRPPADFPDSL